MATTQVEPTIHDVPLEDRFRDKFKLVVYREGVHIEETVEIHYCNSSGESSERNVDLKAYLDRGTVLYLVGYCHLRHELRTFVGARVRRVISHSNETNGADLRRWLSERPRVEDPSLVSERLSALQGVPEQFRQKYDENCGTALVADLERTLGPEVKTLGWAMQCEPASVRLFRMFRSGKIAKVHQVSLTFRQYDTGERYAEDGTVVITDLYPRRRPWIVCAKHAEPGYFDEFLNALSSFRQHAEELAPVKD